MDGSEYNEECLLVKVVHLEMSDSVWSVLVSPVSFEAFSESGESADEVL